MTEKSNLKTFLPVQIVVHRDSHGRYWIEEDDCKKLGTGLKPDESVFVNVVNYSQIERLGEELQNLLDEHFNKLLYKRMPCKCVQCAFIRKLLGDSVG